LSELLVKGGDCLFEHLAMTGSAGAAEVVERAGFGEFERPAAIGRDALFVGERWAGRTASQRLILLCFNRL
jgi:hypothetical protein